MISNNWYRNTRVWSYGSRIVVRTGTSLDSKAFVVGNQDWTRPNYKHDLFTVMADGRFYGNRPGFFWSDRTLKRNIQNIDDPLTLALSLRGVTYRWRPDTLGYDSTANQWDINTDNRRYYGFIAQEVRKVMPTATSWYVRDSAGTDSVLALNYDAITPVAIEAIKAQQASIVDLQNRMESVFEKLAALDQYNTRLLEQLNALVARVDSLSGGGGFDTLDPGLDTLEKFQLSQSIPNPTTSDAIIPYETPDNCTVACTICFHQMAGPGAVPGGAPCLVVPIVQHGPGAVVVPEAALNPGVMYCLRMNGQIVRSRYLVRTQ